MCIRDRGRGATGKEQQSNREVAQGTDGTSSSTVARVLECVYEKFCKKGKIGGRKGGFHDAVLC
eukprot:3941860-Rhodomonas_salina.2